MPDSTWVRERPELRVRTALISDIHGNLDALQVVLADVDRRGVDEIVCLGSSIGAAGKT